MVRTGQANPVGHPPPRVLSTRAIWSGLAVSRQEVEKKEKTLQISKAWFVDIKTTDGRADDRAS